MTKTYTLQISSTSIENTTLDLTSILIGIADALLIGKRTI